MAGSNRRQEYERAKKTGTQLEAWVIRQTSNWDPPVIAKDQIMEGYDLSSDEVLD